jgi:mRNA interferase RelE/StbE
MALLNYSISYKKSVDKDLRSLPSAVRTKIISKIQMLSTAPRPEGSTKLHGAINLYRIRHSDYRIIYQIKDYELIIIVIKVGHRKEVYRN